MQSCICIIINPSATRRAEEAIRDSEERYRSLYVEIPMMYFTLENDSVILSLDTQGAKKLGYRLHELIGETFESVTHEENRRDISRKLAAAVQQSGSMATWESRNVRRRGNAFWTECAFRAIRASDGQVVVLVGCM